MAKRQIVTRLTKAEVMQQRDIQLRGECIAMAAQYMRPQKAPDLLRCADLIFAWMKSRDLPPEPAADVFAIGGATSGG